MARGNGGRAGTSLDDASATITLWRSALRAGVQGQYGEALARLAFLPDAGASDPSADHVLPLAGRLWCLKGSLLRQLGRHDEAFLWDQHALAIAGGTGFGSPDLIGVTDALVGLAADRVGVGDVAGSWIWLRDAGATGEAAAGHWRGDLRRHWVQAETYLLSDDAVGAQQAARRATELAASSGSRRHLCKSQLLLAVATSDADLADSCLTTALRAQWRSLVWPSGLVVASLTPDADRQRAGRLAARDSVCAIAAGLAGADRELWLAKPEVRQLLDAQG